MGQCNRRRPFRPCEPCRLDSFRRGGMRARITTELDPEKPRRVTRKKFRSVQRMAGDGFQMTVYRILVAWHQRIGTTASDEVDLGQRRPGFGGGKCGADLRLGQEGWSVIWSSRLAGWIGRAPFPGGGWVTVGSRATEGSLPDGRSRRQRRRGPLPWPWAHRPRSVARRGSPRCRHRPRRWCRPE